MGSNIRRQFCQFKRHRVVEKGRTIGIVRYFPTGRFHGWSTKFQISITVCHLTTELLTQGTNVSFVHKIRAVTSHHFRTPILINNSELLRKIIFPVLQRFL
jgi:hypothetical protein